MGISGVQANVRSWNCKGDEEIGINGSQIDLLIDRKDQVINVCEMKYATDLYALTKAGEEAIRHKIHDFQTLTGPKAPFTQR